MIELTRCHNVSADLILASASQARTRLLAEAGVNHHCDPAHIDETGIKKTWSGPAKGLAEKLAREKAQVVSARHPGALVIGSDQVLAFGDKIFDKPESVQCARQSLKQLRGHEHKLISALNVVCDGQELWTHTDSAVLIMRSFSDAFLEDYLNRVGEDVIHSVGAYHLEGRGAQLFETVTGDFFTVLGLPLIPLLSFLRTQNFLKS